MDALLVLDAWRTIANHIGVQHDIEVRVRFDPAGDELRSHLDVVCHRCLDVTTIQDPPEHSALVRLYPT
jgi:hypothetical protein